MSSRADRLFRLLLLAGVVGGVLMPQAARATIVERVIAVVGDRPLLLSELRTRVRPFLQQIPPAGPKRAAALSQMNEEMLNRMVDEEMLRRSASKLQISVTQEEITAAIDGVAKRSNTTRQEVMAEVERSGISANDYRKELQRQLLDAKVMNVRLQGRVRVSNDEVNQEYQRMLKEERLQLQVGARAIRVLITEGSNREHQNQQRLELTRVVGLARDGRDFESLSRTYSTEPQTKATGGLLPRVPPQQMPTELAKVVVGMNPGDVSSPIKSGNTWVVIKLLDREASKLPELKQMTGQLAQRVQMRKMDRARRNWLNSARKSTHVDIRL